VAPVRVNVSHKARQDYERIWSPGAGPKGPLSAWKQGVTLPGALVGEVTRKPWRAHDRATYRLTPCGRGIIVGTRFVGSTGKLRKMPHLVLVATIRLHQSQYSKMKSYLQEQGHPIPPAYEPGEKP